MILFLTARGHQVTVGTLVADALGVPIPKTMALSYDAVLRAQRVPAATVIFTDIERLSPFELLLASDVFRSLRAAGLRCLNDPAVVPTRYELLRKLKQAGINPFGIYRAEDEPKPERFPVFVRNDNDHNSAVSDLIQSQEELDAFLAEGVAAGRPRRGLVVIEFCGEPAGEGFWRKFGSFHIGDHVYLDHHITEPHWMVKYGRGLKPPEWLARDEHRRVLANECPEVIGEAFRIAGIDYGRADHATVAGRPVIYEINTNPSIWLPKAQRWPIRDETLAIGRRRMAEAFWSIDSGDGTPIPWEPTERVRLHREALTDKDWSPPRP